MQNEEQKNGIDPISAYLRDVGLWRERLERQRLEIVGHVQRKLHDLAERVKELNERGGFEITMHDQCFQEDLRALGLEAVGAPERVPTKRTPKGSMTQKFEEFVSMYKPGEPITRQEWAKYGKKSHFDYNISRLVKRGKLRKLEIGVYTLV